MINTAWNMQNLPREKLIMSFTNAEVAEAFETIAILLELEGANPFRIRAYRNAARVIQLLPEPITDLIAQKKDLTEYKGIGTDLAGKIKAFLETGHIPLMDELITHHPLGITELTRIENLGPKRIKRLHRELGVSTITDLKSACENELVRSLKGFGEKTEKKILIEINELLKKGESKRLLWSRADEVAQKIVTHLKKSKDIKRIEVAGSYRRRKETVGDLDIVISCSSPEKVMDHFFSFEDIQSIQSQGITRSTIILRSGLHVDLRAFKEESFGSGLYYFTGSKSHNIAIRKIARKKGMKLNEYGVFKGEEYLAGKSEEEIFKLMKLDFIPPELRENNGEIEAAMNHLLPDLITRENICGDLHTHTLATDGRDSIEEMALKAKAMGLQYIAITDHSQSLRIAHGLDLKRLEKHIKDIDEANEKKLGIKILKGIEVDILEDGSLDLPNDILKELDIRICSVHSKLRMKRGAMTKRILKAMENPYFNVLGHPTGRLILKREPSELDFEKIIQSAVASGTFFEINGQPDRLDLDAEHARLAQELGAKFAINSDAHSTMELNFIQNGIFQARRGWIEKKNVINGLSWSHLKKLL